MKNVDWQKVETYEGRKVVVSCGVFRRKRKKKGAKKAPARKRRNLSLYPPIGNMRNSGALKGGGKADFGFEVGGRHFHSLECAYICGVYSGTAPEGASAEERAAFERTCAETQERIRKEKNALYAKKRWREGKAGHEWARAYRRPDWKDGSWHYEWMLYLWTLKIRQVPAFRATIRRIARTWAVVEESPHGPTKPLANPADDELVRKCDGDGWGCVRVRRPDGSLAWRGRNHFGVIAMECAAALREHRSPDVDVAELRRRRIRLFGAVPQGRLLGRDRPPRARPPRRLADLGAEEGGLRRERPPGRPSPEDPGRTDGRDAVGRFVGEQELETCSVSALAFKN